MFSIEAPPAAALLGFQIDTIEVAKVEEIADAIEGAKARGADALYVMGDPLFHSPPERIPDLAARISIPAMYLPREMVQAGGLMAYSSDFMEVTRRSAHVVDRVLRGAHPSELPVEQPTRYELVINLKTAKALGLTVSSSLLARADEVIE